MGDTTINSLDTIKRMGIGNSLSNMLPSANTARKTLYGFGSVVCLAVATASVGTMKEVWKTYALDCTTSSGDPYSAFIKAGLCLADNLHIAEKVAGTVLGTVGAVRLGYLALQKDTPKVVNGKDHPVEANGNGHAPAIDAKKDSVKAEETLNPDVGSPRRSGRRKSVGVQAQQ
jgi:hypothetical protein